MDTLIKQSRNIIDESSDLRWKIRDWISDGELYLENPNKYYHIKYSIDAILSNCVTTMGDIICYHGAKKQISNNDLTDSPLSISKCLCCASNFGSIYKIIVPKDTKCLYIGDMQSDELEIILPQGMWKINKIVNEKCLCGDNCSDDQIYMNELIYFSI